MQKQQGFTLIELMIVVAIIGILAAIAIPQYQNYVARSQVAEAISLLNGAKTGVEQYMAESGQFPDGNTEGQQLTDFGIDNADNDPGKYVASINLASQDDNAGCIVATMKDSGVSSSIQNEDIAMCRDNDGQWHAGKNGDQAEQTTIDAKYLPQAFQEENSN